MNKLPLKVIQRRSKKGLICSESAASIKRKRPAPCRLRMVAPTSKRPADPPLPKFQRAHVNRGRTSAYHVSVIAIYRSPAVRALAKTIIQNPGRMCKRESGEQIRGCTGDCSDLHKLSVGDLISSSGSRGNGALPSSPCPRWELFTEVLLWVRARLAMPTCNR